MLNNLFVFVFITPPLFAEASYGFWFFVGCNTHSI